MTRSRVEFLQRRINEILETKDPSDPVTRNVNAALAALVLLNVAALIVSTLASLQPSAHAFLLGFERASIAVFVAELILRTWACTASTLTARPIVDRLRFLARPLSVVDVLAIVPSLLPAVSLDLRVMRLARLMRMARILKLTRYSATLQAFGRVVRTRGPALASVLVMMACLILISATLMYYAEHDAQPEVFSSIPASAWWAVTTLTTVGYGDAYPVTPVGKVLASAIALLGIAAFAVPAGILAGAFGSELGRLDGRPGDCPTCGQPTASSTSAPAEAGASSAPRARDVS